MVRDHFSQGPFLPSNFFVKEDFEIDSATIMNNQAVRFWLGCIEFKETNFVKRENLLNQYEVFHDIINQIPRNESHLTFNTVEKSGIILVS